MRFPATARNVLIILALAAIVDTIAAGQAAASTLSSAVTFAFLAAFVWIGMRLYQERRAELHAIGARRRAIAYGAGGVAVLVLSATDRMWGTSFGSILWVVLLAGAGYGLYAVYRSTKQY